ncbi:MAG: hypothetical protein WC358_08770 [Ignavibacteria bacterium]
MILIWRVELKEIEAVFFYTREFIRGTASLTCHSFASTVLDSWTWLESMQPTLKGFIRTCHAMNSIPLRNMM